jgi:hypothetical protein
MGVCCGRNVDEPVSRFFEKASKERLIIGNEDIFRNGIYSIEKKDGLKVSDIQEIYTSQFVYNNQPDSHYYDFFVKDLKDKMYNIEIKVLKNTNHQPISTIRELRDEESTKPKEEEVVVDYMKYNTSTNTSSPPKKVKNRNNVITIPKRDNDLFLEESNNILSPPRLTTLSSRSNDNYVYSSNKFSSPIKTVKTDIDTVLTKFKQNADKISLSYGCDEYLIRAIGLIEKKNKIITEIETDIFEYNESEKGIEYRFSFIESKRIRYVCDILMDTEEDTVFLHKPNQKISVDKTNLGG